MTGSKHYPQLLEDNLEIGSNYRILEHSFDSTFGQFYTVLHKNLDCKFLMKVNVPGEIIRQHNDDISTRMYDNSKYDHRKASWNEAKISAMFSENPHILSAINVLEINKDLVGIVYPYYSNAITLQEYLEGFSKKNEVEYFNKIESKLEFLKEFRIQLIESYSELYEKGILHKDLKPANILVDKDKRNLKIIDFGISSHYTDKSGFFGSRCYGPPEYLEGNQERISELWSVGLIELEILFHEYFFKKKDTEYLTELFNSMKDEKFFEYCTDLIDIKRDYTRSRYIYYLRSEQGTNFTLGDMFSPRFDYFKQYDAFEFIRNIPEKLHIIPSLRQKGLKNKKL